MGDGWRGELNVHEMRARPRASVGVRAAAAGANSASGIIELRTLLVLIQPRDGRQPVILAV